MSILKKLFCVMLGLASFVFSPLVFAESASDAVTHLLLNMQILDADFTQRVMDKKAHPLQEVHGHISLQRPGKFRWEVTRPVAQLIIANGARLWIYDKDLEQVTIRSLKRAAGQTPALLLSDKTLTLNKDFFVRRVNSQNREVEEFLLFPKDKESLFESIQLTFTHKQITDMQFKDHLGHTTAIHFSRIRFDVQFSPTLFVFKPLANIDVIDETKH